MAVKQTAGREALGEFAPKFAELNDDVLFDQVWSREDKLSLRDRSIVTVVVRISARSRKHGTIWKRSRRKTASLRHRAARRGG